VRIDPARCPYRVVTGASITVFRASTAALCKSGTSTLEAAVAGCPLVIAYRASAVSMGIARRVVKIPHIGLVNIVAGEEVAPEFIQEAATAEALGAAVLPLLRPESAERHRMLARLDAVRRSLGGPGAARRVAEIAAGMLP
jgi:lipid-A-disaccharide synthase